MIKPEFWQSKTLRKCSLEARLLFIGLWNFCDDYGVCLNSNRKILGEIFPFDEGIKENRLEKWKNELINNQLVIPIEHDSTKYLVIRSWFEHQKVDNPSKRRYLDDNIQEDLVNAYLNSRESVETFYPMKEKEKEKEKEKQKEESEGGDPLQEVVDIWNTFAKENNLATIVGLSDKRKRGVKARSNEKEFDLFKILELIKKSSFLLGKNERGWKVDFDFVFLSPNKYMKILEGKYSDAGRNNKGATDEELARIATERHIRNDG